MVAGLRHPSALVGDHAQHLAGAEAPRAFVRGQRREPILGIRKVARIEFDGRDLQARIVSQHGIGRAVVRNLAVNGDGFGRIAGRALVGASAQACQSCISARGGGDHVFQIFLRVAGLADGVVPQGDDVSGAGRFGRQVLPVFVVLPSAHAHDDQHRRRDNVSAVLIPQLEEPLAPELLVDLPGKHVFGLVGHDRAYPVSNSGCSCSGL